jgi:acyl-CoA reductase-like NAD-dependent aldehyde dehydrogenase
VQKTYKLYIGGQFPRSESGRYEQILDPQGRHLANLSRASRKDLRDAVVAARAAQAGWAARSAYNRGQILYRVSELLEGRSTQFREELEIQGMSRNEASADVAAAVDLWVYMAGWADKVQQVFSSVNPVSSSHFNFSMIEPTGVVAVCAPQEKGLLGLSAAIAPALVTGNTVVALASKRYPLSAITLAEVLHASDVPGGVVNVLTGDVEELLPHMASHLDINALVCCGSGPEQRELAQREAVGNLKRVVLRPESSCEEVSAQGPYPILETCEVKTTWHPIGT